jgi:hypothetical protein
MLGPSVTQTPMAIYRNGEWSVLLKIKNRTTGAVVDITNWRFRATLKKEPNSPTAAANFTFTVVDAAQGHVRMTIDAATRRALPCGPYPNQEESQYWYDVLAASGSSAPFFMVTKGPAEVHVGVTSDV